MGVVSAYLLTKYAYRNILHSLEKTIARLEAQVHGLTEYKQLAEIREGMAKNEVEELKNVLQRASKELFLNHQELEHLDVREPRLHPKHLNKRILE